MKASKVYFESSTFDWPTEGTICGFDLGISKIGCARLSIAGKYLHSRGHLIKALAPLRKDELRTVFARQLYEDHNLVHKLAQVQTHISQYLQDTADLVAIAIEEPARMQGNGIKTIYAVATAMTVASSLVSSKIKVFILAPTEIKKVQTGFGHADKAMMYRAANLYLTAQHQTYQLDDHLAEAEDESDALATAHTALHRWQQLSQQPGCCFCGGLAGSTAFELAVGKPFKKVAGKVG